MLEHPQSDVPLAGSSTALPAAFHTLLQTISDLMPLLPAGSSLQLTAVSQSRHPPPPPDPRPGPPGPSDHL